MNAFPSSPRPVSVAHRSNDRWLAGVCAGIAAFRGLNVVWVRVAFVAGALLGGLGIGLYVACWLILPSADGAEQSSEQAGAVTLASACAAAAGLIVLALIAAVATVFGYGWIVFALAGACLVLAALRRMSTAWVLMPVAALTLPAVAVAASSLRLSPQTGASVVTVKNAATLRSTVYRSGFGTMLIDLRKTSFPTGGTIPLTIRAGIRRTIVALPHDTCVHVVVHDQVHPFAAQLAALLDGHSTPPFSALVLFGRVYGANSGVSPDLTAATPATAVTGPTLDITFSSQGGSLYVRDYPDQQAPGYEPDWPGFAIHIDPKPDRRLETTKRNYARDLAYWRHRVVQERAWQQQVNAETPGPCGS
jgi:phage shock protein PspC (stress-responsive transcriptional regulator)